MEEKKILNYLVIMLDKERMKPKKANHKDIERILGVLYPTASRYKGLLQALSKEDIKKILE